MPNAVTLARRPAASFVVRAASVLLAALAAASAASAEKPPKVAPGEPPVPKWIWAKDAREDQEILVRASFELPADGAAVKSAALWLTCDDEVTAFVNGKRVAHNPIWQVPVTADVAGALVAGRNVMAFAARNDKGEAGFIAKLRVTLADGKTVDVVSGGGEGWRVGADKADGWQTLAFDDANWAPARVIGEYGVGPWDKLPRDGVGGAGGTATPVEQIETLPGFAIELLYSVPKEKQDSWVSMTPDPKGRLIVSGESGRLFRVTAGKGAQDTTVEPIDLPIGAAQGLLWAYDSLYVTVNGGGIGGHGNGVYRLSDTDADDKLDKIERLFELNGQGEHGPHATRLGPDGKIYLVAGNFTEPPATCCPPAPTATGAKTSSSPQPRRRRARPARHGPAGWIVRFDKDGKNRELMLAGLRNTYDIAFNPDGELFTYDSDMEWDTGTPWYRPDAREPRRLRRRVRLAQRHGQVAGVLPGQPRRGREHRHGLADGRGVRHGGEVPGQVPARAVPRRLVVREHLRGAPDARGRGYRGTFERFVKGKPFGVTDVVINPTDGAMYVTIGGRGTQSGLYRVTYTGNESTDSAKPQADEAAAEARALRHKIEEFHGKQGPAAVDFVWQYLGSEDRYLRYAARVALEWQDVNAWKQRALDERNPDGVDQRAGRPRPRRQHLGGQRPGQDDGVQAQPRPAA
jgi:hypothetical protein